jgi:hypothetical protein
LGRSHFIKEDSPVPIEDQACKFCKILFLTGQFNHGLMELINAELLVEAAALATCLSQQSMLVTQSQILMWLQGFGKLEAKGIDESDLIFIAE